jgi:NADH dehydrogenase FAD-containing subunit
MDTNAAGAAMSTEVVVLGAGYAGLIATNRFLGSLTEEERATVHLTVVNPREDFVERIRLHQLAAGSRTTVTGPLTTLLHPDARLVRGTATRICPDRQTVQVDTDSGPIVLPWTWLVYAVGSVGAAAIPGAREHAFLIGDLQDAKDAVAAVKAAGDRPRILVVGGGFTGVETASEFGEQHPSADVTLVCASLVVEGMRSAARAAITHRLRQLRVRLIENMAVLEVENGKAHLADGQIIAFDACLVATAFDVPDLAASSGLQVDQRGRLLVDETLRSVGDPKILGAGDAVAVAGAIGPRLRMACSVALPMGGHVARVLLGTLRSEPPAPFSMGYSAQCISLGRRRGYIQLVNADDSPRRLHIGGAIGAKIKEAVCRRVVEAPVSESEHPGAYTWKEGPASPVLLVHRRTATQDPVAAGRQQRRRLGQHTARRLASFAKRPASTSVSK